MLELVFLDVHCDTEFSQNVLNIFVQDCSFLNGINALWIGQAFRL